MSSAKKKKEKKNAQLADKLADQEKHRRVSEYQNDLMAAEEESVRDRLTSQEKAISLMEEERTRRLLEQNKAEVGTQRKSIKRGSLLGSLLNTQSSGQTQAQQAANNTKPLTEEEQEALDHKVNGAVADLAVEAERIRRINESKKLQELASKEADLTRKQNVLIVKEQVKEEQLRRMKEEQDIHEQEHQERVKNQHLADKQWHEEKQRRCSELQQETERAEAEADQMRRENQLKADKLAEIERADRIAHGTPKNQPRKLT